jgi:hypothetical protein
MDIQDLSAKVMARCAIRIEANDPAFVLVALNQIVLEETAKEMCAQVDTRIAAFAESIQKVERLAGKNARTGNQSVRGRSSSRNSGRPERSGLEGTRADSADESITQPAYFDSLGRCWVNRRRRDVCVWVCFGSYARLP